MPKTRGFSLKHRVAALFRRSFCPARHRRPQNPPRSSRAKPLTRLIGWTRKLSSKAKGALGAGGDYSRVGQGRVLGKPEPVPKGHMAVYVGQEDGGFERVLVPVVYFNHPLFGDLLRESENEFGFNQPGRFTIPCRVSEFERVQTRIKTGRCNRVLKNPNRSLSS